MRLPGFPTGSNSSVVETSPKGVKVSLYNRPGQGLIAVIVNATDRPSGAEVTFNLAALQQQSSLAAHAYLRPAAPSRSTQASSRCLWDRWSTASSGSGRGSPKGVVNQKEQLPTICAERVEPWHAKTGRARGV